MEIHKRMFQVRFDGISGIPFQPFGHYLRFPFAINECGSDYRIAGLEIVQSGREEP